MSNNPCKKMRLDFRSTNDGSVGNEDLWGQDDLTAEEFDMLEIQATQSCNQNISHQNHLDYSSISDQLNRFCEVDDTKQYQYELEGRIKLLSQTLEKSVKELSEERLNREHMINDRLKEFSTRETNLLKEIEKIRSILEFKDQEMKSTYSKLQLMKSQLLDKKNITAETLLNKNFEDFLKSSKCDPRAETGVLKTSDSLSRRCKLLIDTPKGETKGIDLLSSILCTRLAIPNLWNLENTVLSGHLKDSSSNFDITSVSVVQLKDEEKNEEFLGYYKSFLINHVIQLKTQASKSNHTSSIKSSPTTVKQKEVDSFTVISFLSDIAYLLSCSKFIMLFKKQESKKENVPMDNRGVKQLEVSGNTYSDHLPYNLHSKNSSVVNLRDIVEPLLELTDPKTYPVGYPKNEEIEYSLLALRSICLSYPDKFMELDFELPIHSFLNPHQNVTALCATLKLFIAMCCYKSFALHLTHKNDNCMLCLIATFLVSVVPYYPEKFSSPVLLIEDFLSSAFSVHDMKEICLETSPCTSEVIRGIIKSVWKYCQLKEKNNRDIQIVKKGFILLHTLSSCIPNFKESRSSVEDEYISLITSILDVSKENSEFKEFYDLIHSLWDFQTDTTEFDLDDITEEYQASATENNVIE